MRERFADRQLTGKIKISMDSSKGIWEADKGMVVANIIAICEEYQNAGDILTLRQLYYQLVSRDIIPNHDKVYKKISSIKDDIVYSGLVDWQVFEDRGRQPIEAYSEDSISGALERTKDYYKLDRQTGQPIHIEVWTEKDAISGILRKVTLPYSVPLVVNKGYNSSTAMYNAYDRFVESLRENRKIRILYFGDHDPSGLDMVRDIKERLMFMFTRGEQMRGNQYAEDYYRDLDMNVYDIAQQEGFENCSLCIDPDGVFSESEKEEFYELFESGKVNMWMNDKEMFDIIHIGLTKEQINQYTPPPNPAKITDPRAKWYIQQHGEVSWEVDALTPDTMRKLVKTNVEAFMDMEVYQQVLEREKTDKEKLTTIIKDLQDEE